MNLGIQIHDNTRNKDMPKDLFLRMFMAVFIIIGKNYQLSIYSLADIA